MIRASMHMEHPATYMVRLNTSAGFKSIVSTRNVKSWDPIIMLNIKHENTIPSKSQLT